MDDELLRVLTCFESVSQAANAMRAAAALTFPRDLRTRAPLLVALVQRCESDDQAVVVVQVSHSALDYRQVPRIFPIIPASRSPSPQAIFLTLNEKRLFTGRSRLTRSHRFSMIVFLKHHRRSNRGQSRDPKAKYQPGIRSPPDHASITGPVDQTRFHQRAS